MSFVREYGKSGRITVDLVRVTWRKSSYSGNNGGNCVEITTVPGQIAGPERVIVVRDSKDPHGPVLVLAPGDWQGFATRLKLHRPSL